MKPQKIGGKCRYCGKKLELNIPDFVRWVWVECGTCHKVHGRYAGIEDARRQYGE